MAPPLILRVITDIRQALKANDELISSNTLVGRSAIDMGGDVELAARAMIAANVKQIESARALVAQTTRLGAVMKAEGDDRIAINRAIAASQLRLDAALGVTATSTTRTGAAAKEAERDFGKLTRGAIAGSGAASALGRSLAFASTGFIAVAGGATIIASSIRAAEDLEAAQRRADRQLQTSGKTWEQYGGQIDSVLLKEGHLAGFTRSELLGSFTFLLRVGGNVSNSLHLVAEAADIARGRGISLQAASIALSKALGGSATALRRLGIIVPNNVSKMAALNYVQEKFAGQAKAGTTASERFTATMTDAEAEIGAGLLPTFEHLITSFSKWVHRLQETGELKRDLHELGAPFRLLGEVIKDVDDITGGFANTIKLLINIRLAFWIAKWIKGLELLAAEWGLVGNAAVAAGTKQEAALAVSATRGAGGAAAVGAAASTGVVPIISRGRDLTFATKAGQLTTVSAQAESRIPTALKALGGMATALEGLLPIAAAVVALQILESKTYKDLRQSLRDAAGHGIAGDIVHDLTANITELPGEVKGSFDHMVTTWKGFLGLLKEKNEDIAKQIERERNALGLTRLDRLFPVPTGPPPMTSAYNRAARTSYEVPTYLQVAQAQAGLTASIKDDVSVARRIIKNIKRIIDRGNYTQKGLLALLEAEASALGVVQQAQDAARAKAAARKAAAEAAASTFEVPAYLQLAQAKAEAYGRDQTSILKKIIAAAEAAIRSGRKNWKGLIAAYNAIAAARSALAQQAQDQLIPLRLQLQLARAQATGGDQTKILLKMRAALYRALKKAKGNIQRQIDIWNQIAQINSEMGNSITNAYGNYKKASVKALTANLKLTAEQRRELEARLSRVGPGGTVPASGTGAAGYIIDPETGRPVRRGHHAGHSNRAPGGSGGGGGSGPVYRPTFVINVELDGEKLTRRVTINQQRHRRRNPPSRRGPNAATASA